MPPRKSNVSTTSHGGDEGAESTPARSTKDGMSVEDLSLPKSMIARLAKGVLPANTQIHKDALLALHKSATVFVSYIASNSSENAQAGGKKTIMPQDVTAALKDAELEEFLPRLEAELKKYNETQCDKRNTYRRKVKEEKAAAQSKDTPEEGGANGEAAAGESGGASGVVDSAAVNGASVNGHAEVDDAERPTKKLRGDDGEPILVDADQLDDSHEADQEDAADADEQDDDEAEEDGAEDEDEEGEGEPGEEEGLDEPEAEMEGRGEFRDEALDEPDSD